MRPDDLTDEQRERIWKRVCEMSSSGGTNGTGKTAESAGEAPHSTTTLCRPDIRITGKRRAQLMAAAQRLGLEWPAVVCRIEAACQDAAVRKMRELAGD